MAAVIPAAVFFMPPVMAPMNPLSAAPSMAPLAKEYPNPGSGTVAPLFPNSTNGSYRPKPPKTAPATTKITNILGGVNFVVSINICPTTQITPPIINVYT